MNIVRVGYFKEMPHGEVTDPSIKETIGKVNPKWVKQITQYLDDGISVIACAGFVEDVVNPEKGNAGIPSMLTDGTWYWPGDLSYYVKNYHVGLADAFIATMKQNHWENPLSYEELDFDALSVDGEFIFKE